MKHFETKAKAIKWRDSNNKSAKIFKKIKGMKNRIKKPFLVGSEFEWLNQN